MLVGDQPGRAERVRVEHGGAVAHRLRGMDEHPAELPAADDAERRPRRDVGHGRFARAPGRRLALDAARHLSWALIARAASVWRARYASSRPRRPASPEASRATAKSAALAAPALPIANVATGMPLGIWTIE